jgi:hypothetical protein
LKREDKGEITVYACVKRKSLLFLSFAAGKWTQNTCGKMIEKASERMASGRVQFYSDGNDDYTYILPLYFEDLDYGQLVKKRIKGRVVDKEKRIIHGFPGMIGLETTSIEGFNSILRERLGRLVRKTKCYAKKLITLNSSLEIFQFYWNMIKLLKGSTPAMKEHITVKPWTWNDLLTYHYTT